MKKICYYWQIPTPNYAFVFNEEDMEAALSMDLKYPLFVKHFHGYNSVGITLKSKVETPEQLKEQTMIMVDKHGGALIEEFIDGREFSVLIVGNAKNPQDPIAFRPVECVFDEHLNFKTFDYKWKGEAKNPWIPVKDEELGNKLKEISKQMYLAIGCDGYARTDVRMDAQGNLYLDTLSAPVSKAHTQGNSRE
jgi:D-alanine-D-alanine ligase